MNIRVMTFNCWHFADYETDNTRLLVYDKYVECIRKYNPDVIAFQEVRGKGSHELYQPQMEIMAEKLGGYTPVFGKAIDFPSGPYGNGVLTRLPVLSTEVVPIPDPEVQQVEDGYYETRCMLKVRLDVPGGLTIVATHFGLNPDEHDNAVSTFEKTVEDRRCVFMGDLNVTPEDPHLDAVRARMNDTADYLTGEKLSFPSDAPDRKIDYIFTSKDISVLQAEIPAEVASDHRPYYADIAF